MKHGLAHPRKHMPRYSICTPYGADAGVREVGLAPPCEVESRHACVLFQGSHNPALILRSHLRNYPQYCVDAMFPRHHMLASTFPDEVLARSGAEEAERSPPGGGRSERRFETGMISTSSAWQA
jgi:hypothetical protein